MNPFSKKCDTWGAEVQAFRLCWQMLVSQLQWHVASKTRNEEKGERLGTMLSAQFMPNQWIILPPQLESTQMSKLLCHSEVHSQYARWYYPPCVPAVLKDASKSFAPLRVWMIRFHYHFLMGRNGDILITVSIRVLELFLGFSLMLRVNLGTCFSMFTGWSSTENSKNSRRLWPGPNRKVCENQFSVQWSGGSWPGDHSAGPSSSL